MPLTNNDKAALARLCGAKMWWSHESGGQPSEPGWLFEQLKPAWPVIMCDQWNPANNGQHTIMVLEALRGKGECLSVTWDIVDSLWRVSLRLKISDFRDYEGKDKVFGSAVCAAGLEFIGKGGG